MPTKEATTDINLKDLIVNAIQDKKGKSVTHLDLSAIDNIPCEHFIICSGNSQPQVKAIAEEVQKQVFDELGEHPLRKEGYQYQEWIILDYFNIVVHIFLPEKRDFYKLEELWSDGEKMIYEDII
jgi:ribosome-associated protein